MDIDVAVAEWLNGVSRSGAVRPIAVWTANEFALVLVATLVIGGFALAGRDLLTQRQVRFGLIEGAAVALLALGLGMLINQVIGAAWVRPRPYDVISGVNLLTAPSADPSFPSDHATAAFSLALGIGVASRSLKTILFGQALLLGLARVAVGLHYPTDIAAGLCVGLSSAAIADVAVTPGRYRLHQATSSIVGWAVPVGAPARRDGRPRLALASGGLFAVLLGMPVIVEAAADPVRFQPEWLEWVSLMVLAVLLGAVWLALTRFAMKAQTRSARPAAARAEAG